MDKSDCSGELLGRMASWGCDVSGALPRFVGDREFYCRMLALVPEEEDFAKLGVSLAAGDAKAAFNAAHTLKGVLGNLGLTPMYEETCAIVEPLRAGVLERTQEHYEELLRQKAKLERLLSGGDA